MLGALLLKWRQKISYAAAPLAIGAALTSIAQSAGVPSAVAPVVVAAPSWSVLHVGMRVFTGGITGQTVCPTIAALFHFEKEGQSTRCMTIPRGVPAVIDMIIWCKRSDPAWGYESPHVRIHSRDGSWRGFADAASLQPVVPTGALLDMERDWGAPLVIESDNGSHTVIGGSALVRLLRYNPSREASLYVEVLKGAYRNRRGWMFLQDAYTGGDALGQYGLEYPYKACLTTGGGPEVRAAAVIAKPRRRIDSLIGWRVLLRRLYLLSLFPV